MRGGFRVGAADPSLYPQPYPHLCNFTLVIRRSSSRFPHPQAENPGRKHVIKPVISGDGSGDELWITSAPEQLLTILVI